MDPFLQSTVAKNRQCFPTRSTPLSYPTSGSNKACDEFHTPEGIYRLERKWLIPYIIPHFATGTHVTIARNPPRVPMGSTLGLTTTRTTVNQTSSTTSSSISDIIYGSSSSTSLSGCQTDSVSPNGERNIHNGMTIAQHSTDKPGSPILNIPIASRSNRQHSLSKQSSQSSDLLSTSTTTPLSTIPTLSVESISNDKETSELSLATTLSNTGSFSSLFSGHWRNYHSDHHSPRPKSSLFKLKSSFIENVQTHATLSKILANRQRGDTFLFYNNGACFLWMDSKMKDFLTCITFSKTIPTCHDINKTTLANDRLDIIIGFSTGDCIWYDPLCHRYTRFNKHGVLHNAKVTDIKWVPGSEDLFMVSFDDGAILILDRDREDQPLTPQQAKLSSDYEFIIGKPTYKHSQYNPVSFWYVNRNGITAMEFSKDGSLVAMVGSDGLLRIFDFAEERQVCRGTRHLFPSRRFTHVLYIFRLYDIFSGYFGKLLCLAWSPDNNYILTGGQDDLITIWSLADQCIVARCQGHKSWVTGLAFDAQRCDEKVYRFASVGEDCKLILWDFSTSMLHKPKKHKHTLVSCILPHRDSSTGRSTRLSATFHLDSNGGMHHVPEDKRSDEGDNDQGDDTIIDATARSFCQANPKPSRFLKRRPPHDDSPSSSNTGNGNHLIWTLAKKWPATIHPLMDKSRVPFLQPLATVTAHADPCTGIYFDSAYDDGVSNGDGDDNGDSDISQLSSTVSNVTGLGGTVESIKSVGETVTDGQYYGALSDKDLDWTLASGSSTENQVFYVTTRTGGFAFVQLIHSNIGIWNPTISFTCRFYDPSNNTNIFKNINMSKFELSEDKRSVKTDFFNITLDAEQQTYKVQITHPDLVVSLDFTRVDRGFKVGEGRTYLGGDQGSAAGYVSHKFWPRAQAKGTFIVDKQLHEVEGDGMFIHAIQGMQPQLIASNWNFVDFQAPEAALSMMQFQTTKQYGAVNINQGSLVLHDKLICVSIDNHVELLDLQKDEDTEYDIPQRIKLTWKGKTIKEDGVDEPTKDVSVEMIVTVKNLVDKIDVLAEIPWFLKKLVQTFVVKPYIYQWLDKATATITVGDQVVEVEGNCFQELVFVSGF